MIDLSLDEHDDGAVSQSGWVFADLLIALSVIFLATISFVPAITSGGSGLTSDAQVVSKVRSQGFSKIYDRVDAEQLARDLAEFRKNEALSESIPLMHLHFVASTRSNEAESDVLRALRFSIAVRESQSWTEMGATTSLSTSESLDQGQILVKAVFGSVD
ncbi:MAG: hypothetical protein ACKOFU_04215 [Actinomycetota bacterium]